MTEGPYATVRLATLWLDIRQCFELLSFDDLTNVPCRVLEVADCANSERNCFAVLHLEWKVHFCALRGHDENRIDFSIDFVSRCYKTSYSP